jgi:hypothetical protein
VIPTEILLVCKKVFEPCNFVGCVLINREIAHVRTSPSTWELQKTAPQLSAEEKVC